MHGECRCDSSGSQWPMVAMRQVGSRVWAMIGQSTIGVQQSGSPKLLEHPEQAAGGFGKAFIFRGEQWGTYQAS